MSTKRTYKGKDVDMLTACAIIVENAIANQDFLMSKRSSWTPGFFGEIQTRIDNAFNNYLGIDSALQMRQATQFVLSIQRQSLNELFELKIQIEEDFKSDKTRRDEILRTLGYSAAHYQKAQAGDQEALVQLLYQFRRSLGDSLRNEIIDKGISSRLLDNISSYADQLSKANITQETHKETRKNITGEAVGEFVEIYNQVISIARIARMFYKGNPERQSLFSYSRILKTLNAPK